MKSKKKILYVDGDRKRRSEVERTLRCAGYDVCAAHGFQAALVAASSNSFDLILVHATVSASWLSLLSYYQRSGVPVMYTESQYGAADSWHLLRRLSFVLNSNP